MDKKIKLPKSVKLYLSNKLKKVASLNLNSPINPSRLRSACQYPKTPSFDKRDYPNTNHRTINHAATLSDIDRFLFENFSSLYINNHDSPLASSLMKPHTRLHEDFLGSSASTSSLASSSSTTDEIGKTAAGVGIVTFTTNPYEDFRSSMMRMVVAHHTDASQPLDWDFMEELLICYMQLNDKSMHKHILRAFSDITAGFRRSGVSVVSRRTVPVSTKKQMAGEKEEMSDSPCQHFPDFPEDFDNEPTKK